MADVPPQSADQFASADPPADQDETNWGEDWESAFQAEDDAFFSDSKDEDFFLEESEPTVSPGIASQDLDASLEKTLAGIPDQDAAAGSHPAKALAGSLAIPALLLSAKTFAQTQFTRLQAFPVFIRVPLYALPLLIIGLFSLLLGTLKPTPTLRQTAPVPAQHAENTMAALEEHPPGSPSPEAHQASQLHPGKVRKKWAFPAFVIPVKNPDANQSVTFILVDITLIASLEEQEEPPADKKTFVRDIIYQFFQNKPIEELRRFSLARGEMNRELRAWLQKQWPDAPIESIIFNQYHLS